MGGTDGTGTRTWSDHVAEMEKVLGIEAARSKIMEQVHLLCFAFMRNTRHRWSN